ncbi:unnamed protein product [Caenorhabditis angaria]|uniref:Uncharacterized protein n=1 Tax=Caenorhabditis angaria TaxID=860376 RepID=A0A9P1IB50_9PELO|nr:unnamed protein product [Caenorhabditis angaria]
MRIRCCVVFSRSSITGRGRPQLSRRTEADLILERVGGNYQIRFEVQNNRERNVFPLNPFPQIVQPVGPGRISLTFPRRPQTLVLCDNIDLRQLRELMIALENIRNGVDVTLQPSQSRRGGISRPSSVLIRNAEDYLAHAINFTDQVTTFIIQPIGKRVCDPRWRNMPNLTRLVLNGNLFGDGPNPDSLEILASFRHLLILEISQCRLGTIPVAKLNKAISQLSPTIHYLNLSNNEIRKFPRVIPITQLRRLDISRNLLTRIPWKIVLLRNLIHLDVSSNNLSSFPSTIETLQLPKFFCNQNPAVLPIGRRFDETTRRLENPWGFEYSHPGGVDRLATIAAHVVNTTNNLRTIAQQIIPKQLSHEYVNSNDPQATEQSVDLCSVCGHLTQIRSVTAKQKESGSVAQEEIDVVNQNLVIAYSKCIRCSVKPVHQLQLSPDFHFNGNLF